jgi:superfamily II DNA or RNA helicase
MLLLDYNKSYRKGKILTDNLTLEKIRKHFSVKIDNIDMIRRKSGNAFIPDREYAIPKTGMFDFGLREEIIKYLDSKNIDFEFTENYLKQTDIRFNVETVFDGLKLKHRDYGLEAVSNALESGCGTILSSTGSGKSMLTASLIENIRLTNTFDGFKCLIIVPGLSLVEQLNNDFIDYGVTFTHSGWTGKNPLKNTEVVICNTENFCASFDKHPWIKNVNLLIQDECHKCGNSTQLSKKISKVKTPHKYGFTGTLPKEKIDEWKIIGTFGPIIFEKQSKELRDAGYLTQACVKVVKLNHKNPPVMNYRQELEYVYKSGPRHIIVRKIVSKLKNNSLILVNHIEHGMDTLDSLSSIEGRDVYFVHGGMPVEERQKIIRKMEIQDNIICIAMSSIFSTGINIKNIHYILFLSGGKSFIRIVQSIGRGLRLHDSKNKLTLIDICDNLRYSMEHVEKRKEFYQEQEIEWKECEVKLS